MPTDTPCITPTDTEKCKCDCGSELTFNSKKECDTYKSRNCFENCTCKPITCEGNGECTPNDSCVELTLKNTPTPTPTFTPTGTTTCPQNCEDCGKECDPSLCKPIGGAFGACCQSSLCTTPGCLSISGCEECTQQFQQCSANRGYSSLEICDQNRPNPPEEWVCKDCTITGICKKEPCFCPEPAPTVTPTPTQTETFTCNCVALGYVEVGNCGYLPAAQTADIQCPPEGIGAVIKCDICQTPTPSATCKCESSGSEDSRCFSFGPDCQTYKNQREGNEYVNCYCNPRDIPCGIGQTINCTCGTCVPITPPPTPTGCSQEPPPGCCKEGGHCEGRVTRCQTCNEWTEPVFHPNDSKDCPPWNCYVWSIRNSNQFYLNTAQPTSDGGCDFTGPNCTTSTQPACPAYGNKFVFLTTSPVGPADGTFRRC